MTGARVVRVFSMATTNVQIVDGASPSTVSPVGESGGSQVRRTGVSRSRWSPVWLCVLLAGQVVARGDVDYVRDIKPLLRERCLACHGALKQKASLRLDTLAAMLQGGKTGPAILRGNAASSELVRRIAIAEGVDRMPPEHEGELFSPEQVARVKAWIDAGAAGPSDEVPESDPKDHWAFRPRVRPAIPNVTRREWVRNPIDAFIAEAHERNGLTPQDEAPRETLIRRLYVDLVGVPPVAAELEAVERDALPGWYERLVDRLLEDPRHGERWARHWMDIWRYSDWWGLGDQLRNSQKHIWRWRDWMVESLNADLPYDEMLRLMLAADELHPNDLGKLRATGYLARNYFLFNRNQWMDEVVEHVGKGLLGLTLNCAKCHDHKYDPIPQADYYRMRAFFEPYHVRLDVVPGEPDLNRDGLPRVFDGLPDAPTYRFVRGQEGQPDTSVVLAPGVPELLAFRQVSVRPVPLPEAAWKPERRTWVLDAYRDAARMQMERMEADVILARRRLALVRELAAADAAADADDALKSAQAAEALARAEWESVERRSAAMMASWEVGDLVDRGTSAARTQLDSENRLAKEAAQAEHEVRVRKARQTLVMAELKLRRAAGDKRPAVEGEVAQAREALQKLGQGSDGAVPAGTNYTLLTGATWTPTRFFDSTKDDPRVAFQPVSTGRRKALAEWITDPRHPLTARVGVNHLWARHLGVPLVGTVFDFGRKGSAPTHPGLLEWLACEWVDSGWSMKHMHRLIVTSAAYRMGSSMAGGEVNVAKDPDNRLFWRRVPARMEAQVVRDAILAHSGELDFAMGGPPVGASDQAESRRRSLYFYHSNNDRNLFLTTFDDAAVKECYRRDQSIVPQQALALYNSRLSHDSAVRIAGRLTQEVSGAGDSGAERFDERFVRRAFTVLLGYEPAEAEIALSLRAIGAWRELKASDGGMAVDARANLIWALLNHNDFVTLR